MKVYGDAQLPQYATEGSAGFDLIADNFKKIYPFHIPSPREIEPDVTEIMLEPQSRILIGTGIAVSLPQGFCLDIRPRSGLALKHGITVLNTPGLVDEDFTGEIGVILINTGCLPFNIKLGDKIAQGVVTCYCKVEWNVVEKLEETKRGSGGFGHSDIKSELKYREQTGLIQIRPDDLSKPVAKTYVPMPVLEPFDARQHENLK